MINTESAGSYRDDNVRSSRFLAAFHAIETQLRAQVAATRVQRPTFYELVDSVAQVDAAVLHHRLKLKAYADLRNAIVHERIGPEPIAEPHMQTVLTLEYLADCITRPPRLRNITSVTKTVDTCSPADQVSVAARRMRHGNFSQLPVVDGQEIVGLLTAETVARWLGQSMANDEIVLGVPVMEVLEHAEAADNWRLLSVDATVYDAARLFDARHLAGADLDAIVLTQSGRPRERILGIVTIFDYPNLIKPLQ